MVPDTNTSVIARLDRAIQYAATFRWSSNVFGILDPRLRGDDENGQATDV
jgi:hypothetical protein